MMTNRRPNSAGSAPLAHGTAPLGEGNVDAARFAALSHASGALAQLRLTQMRTLQQRFRNDLQSVCSLASWHGSRADGIASEAGFKAVGRRVMALAALYDELLYGGGTGSVGFAAYLERLCARLSLAEFPDRALILLAKGNKSVPSAPDSMDGDVAAALGTVVAELVAAVAGYGQGDVTVHILPPNGCQRMTVCAEAGPDDDHVPQLGREHDLVLAKTLLAQVGGKLDRFVSCTGAGWCIRF